MHKQRDPACEATACNSAHSIIRKALNWNSDNETQMNRLILIFVIVVVRAFACLLRERNSLPSSQLDRDSEGRQ